MLSPVHLPTAFGRKPTSYLSVRYRPKPDCRNSTKFIEVWFKHRRRRRFKRLVFSWTSSLERIRPQCSLGRHRRSRLVVHIERLRTQPSLVPRKPDSRQIEMPSPAESARRAALDRNIADGEFGSWCCRTTCLSHLTSIDGEKLCR